MAFPRCLGGALCPYGDIRISDIFSDGSADKKRALWIYAAQLAVNFSWSIVFFKYEKLWAGATVIILLIVLVMLMIYSRMAQCPVSAVAHFCGVSQYRHGGN